MVGNFVKGLVVGCHLAMAVQYRYELEGPVRLFEKAVPLYEEEHIGFGYGFASGFDVVDHGLERSPVIGCLGTNTFAHAGMETAKQLNIRLVV
jgi:hypothetical protein